MACVQTGVDKHRYIYYVLCGLGGRIRQYLYILSGSQSPNNVGNQRCRAGFISKVHKHLKNIIFQTWGNIHSEGPQHNGSCLYQR